MDENIKDLWYINGTIPEYSKYAGDFEIDIPFEETTNRCYSQEKLVNLICNTCTNVIDYEDLQICKECSLLFCLECFAEHKKAMNKIYSRISPDTFICSLHNIERGMFCSDVNCTLAVCSSCAVDYHKDHQLCSIDAQAKHYLNFASTMKHQNQAKLNLIKKTLSGLTKKKESFLKDAKEVEMSFLRRYEDLISIVNGIFKEQLDKLNEKRDKILEDFSAQIQNLEKLQEEISFMIQIHLHSPEEISDFEVVTYYRNLESPAKIKVDNKTHIFEFQSFNVKPEKRSASEIRKIIESLVGRIHIFVNDSIYTSNPSEAFQTSLIYESKDELIKAFCYDTDVGDLYVLTLRDPKYYLLKISGTIKVKEFPLNINCNNSTQSISLLSNRSIILLNDSKLNLISDDISLYSTSLPEELSELEDIQAISSSPCKTCVFVYSRSGKILKYNTIDDVVDTKPIEHEVHPDWITVHENCDYLAICGFSLTGIYIWSYKIATSLKVLGRNAPIYRTMSFLSENVLAAYNEKTSALELFSLNERRFFRKISFLNSKGKKVKFGYICAIAMCSSNTIFVCDKCDVHNLYQIMI